MNIEDVKTLTPLNRLIYWIEERESIRLRKERGDPRPWTDDAILDRYRFCNVRRMDDRVSRWLLDEWYRPNFDHKNMLQAAALARFVNTPRCLATIGHCVFTPDGSGPKWKTVKEILRVRKSEGTVFNPAYMVRGNTSKSPDKIGTVIDEYIGALVEAEIRVDTTSMEATHAAILPVYGFGSFMAGQVVADLRWGMSGTWADRDRWAPRGPGSVRGMNRLHGREITLSFSQETFGVLLGDLIAWCRKVLPSSISERLEAMDYQSCLCELDKYERTLFEGRRPKSIYRE